MSKFRTVIPINTQAVIAALPPRSFVHSTTLLPDASGVEIIWDCDDLKTAYTFPLDYPAEKLNVIGNVNVKESVDKGKRRGKTTVEDA